MLTGKTDQLSTAEFALRLMLDIRGNWRSDYGGSTMLNSIEPMRQFPMAAGILFGLGLGEFFNETGAQASYLKAFGSIRECAQNETTSPEQNTRANACRRQSSAQGRASAKPTNPAAADC